VYVAVWIDVYVTIALLFVLSTRWRTVPQPVRFLSDVSYAVYLYHLLVIYAGWNPDDGVPAAHGATAALAAWSLGLAVPIVVAVTLRRVIGARARVVFGG
jgi:membrane-bound acyltransferase YfiQ involved in biofilm formation